MLKTNWQAFIDFQKKQDYFKTLLNFVDLEYKSKTVYPSFENVFKCFNFFDIEQTKVVIVGQDPYYTPNYAHGLAFSVDSNKTNKTQKSLINIFKELNSDFQINRTNPDLTNWATQGVLLLNRVLTVVKDQPNSHSNKGWETFTDNVIKHISNHANNVVFVLWGNNAKTLSKYIDRIKHLILESSHPSPLSCYNGFNGSKPFSKINNYLVSKKKLPISW